MADVTPETPAAGSAPKKKTNLVPILIVIGVIVVVIIGVGGYLFLKDDDEASKPAGPPPPRLSKNLYAAWQGDDRTAAAKNATAAAVSQIFAIPASEGEGLTFGGCTKVGDKQLPKACVYSRPGGELTMTVNLQGDTRTVTKVEFGPAGLPPDTTG
jgi:hypothetical protein